MFMPPRVITLADLTREYWQSAEFLELSAPTQVIYRGALKTLLTTYSREAAVKFTRDALDLAMHEAGARYSAGRFRQLKAAYRRFSEWSLRERQVPLPPLSRATAGRPSRAQKPPKEVVEAIVSLLDNMPWRELTQRRLLELSWSDLQAETDEEDGETVVLFPSKRSHAWVRIPPGSPESNALGVLWQYTTTVGKDAVGPLVPAYPGATVALPLVWLRECLSQARGNPVSGLRNALTQSGEVEGDTAAPISGGIIEGVNAVGSEGV